MNKKLLEELMDLEESVGCEVMRQNPATEPNTSAPADQAPVVEGEN